MKKELVKLFLKMRPDHQRNCCSDEDYSRWYAGQGNYAPKCDRCALLKALDDEEWRRQMEFDFELHVQDYYEFMSGK